MTRVTRTNIDNACYHIYARGNQKQAVFINSDDYFKYLALLHKYKRRYSFKVYGYCLMPNHIHLLGQVEKAASLSKLIQATNRTYTGYFNYTYKKVGHLWQGRFKSKVIVKDQYFINCINYIECNPVRAGIVSRPDEYSWSSYNERNMLDYDFSLLTPLTL